MPRVRDLAERNTHLRTCRLRERVQVGQTETIGQRFARERDKALSLPTHPFDPCRILPAKAD